MKVGEKIGKLICLMALFTFISGCGTSASTVVNINRERYSPALESSLKDLYKGKKVFLEWVVDSSKDADNFYYFSPDKNVAYEMAYKSDSWQQPLASFYWYAYQKALESLGMTVEEHNPSKDSPALTFTFLSLNSRELNLRVLLRTKGISPQVLTRDYTITMTAIAGTDVKAMEAAAYEMIDKTVSTVLSDPEFQKVFLK